MEQVKENFDFKVIRRPLFTELNGQTLQTEKDCIIRTDTKDVLGYVSKEDKKCYEIIKHADVVHNARKTLSDYGLEYTEDNRLTRNGSRMYHTFTFPEMTIEPVVGDFVNMQLRFTNSYDGFLMQGFELGGLRLVCSNGMKSFQKAFFHMRKHNRRHTVNDTMYQLKQAMSQFTLQISGFYKLLGKSAIDAQRGLSIIEKIAKDKLFPQRYAEEVKNEWVNPRYDLDKVKNLWTLYNAFTYIISHHVKSVERQMALHSAVERQFKQFTQ